MNKKYPKVIIKNGLLAIDKQTPNIKKMDLPHEVKEIPYRNRYHFALVNNVDGIFPGQIVRHKRTKKLLGAVGNKEHEPRNIAVIMGRIADMQGLKEALRSEKINSCCGKDYACIIASEFKQFCQVLGKNHGYRE